MDAGTYNHPRLVSARHCLPALERPALASASTPRRHPMLKCWQSDGFIFYVMGIVLMLLALYVLTGEAVVRCVEFIGVGDRLTVIEQRLTQLEVPPVVKKPWWRRRGAPGPHRKRGWGTII